MVAYMIYLPAMTCIEDPIAFAFLWTIPIGNLGSLAFISLKTMISNPDHRATDMAQFRPFLPSFQL